MEKDLLYIYDKETWLRTTLGEVQSGFNMSMVIDGTKDSMAVVVVGFQETEIEPFTVAQHKNTKTWWIVSRDKVDRYAHENGLVYIHNLQLVGAVELLNARDLTDCGFNAKTYSVGAFIHRLFSLSTFEFNVTLDSYGTGFLIKEVDFLKTFENYTLLSALREFLNNYNYACKLSFSDWEDKFNNVFYLSGSCVLTLISKTGDNQLPIVDINFFDDVRETKIVDANSFGSTAISNAENVISSKPKTFPSTGSIKLSSTEHLVKPNNAVIRLPSNVYKGNWIRLIFDRIVLGVMVMPTGGSTPDIMYDVSLRPLVDGSLEKIIENLRNTINAKWIGYNYGNLFYLDFMSKFSYYLDILKRASSFTMYDGNKVVPTFGGGGFDVEIHKGDKVPHLVKAKWIENLQTVKHPMIFADKDTKALLKYPEQGIQWERGTNIVSGFEFLSKVTGVDPQDTDLQDYDGFDYSYTLPVGKVTIKMSNVPLHYNDARKPTFIVNYIPMTDIKLKEESGVKHNDIKLFNQTGKLTDATALSKLMGAYAKEISSNSITRFKTMYSFTSVPKVGSFVNVNNVEYVINNVSMNFSDNENSSVSQGYFMDCEFSMAKRVAVKSSLVSPNSDIRDYGTPQTFNVKRKQLYRDYYELSYETKGLPIQEAYLSPSVSFTFDHTQKEDLNFICTIDVEFENEVEGQTHWYYQLETTNYHPNKSLYVILDFSDNNIIGYGSQNVFSGFDVTRIFSGLTDTLNTPISYVDTKGNLKGLTIRFSTKEQLISAYNDYQSAQVGGGAYEGTLYNSSVFIDGDLINNYIEPNKEYSIKLSEPNYNKDAIEVPVFQYVCQCGDSDDVLIGDNIFGRKEECVCFYSYVVGDNLNQNNVQTPTTVQGLGSPGRLEVSNGAKIQYYDGVLEIRIYERQYYLINELTWHNANSQDFEVGKDYAFFRHSYNSGMQEEIVELLFIAKKTPLSQLSLDKKSLGIKINYYKMK